MKSSSPSSSSASPSPLVPLLTPEGMRLMTELTDSVEYSESEALGLSMRLRDQGHSPELVSAVLTQLKLRAAAGPKFGEFASGMLFTRDGLEQATRLKVAAHHARRFAQAGVTHVVDLGCGLGADAMACASLGLQVTAVEQDETVAAAATMNLMAFPEARVVGASAEDWLAENLESLPDGTGFWFDPARRELTGAAAGSGADSRSRRFFDPEAFSPPLSFVEQLADAGFPVGVKLGPGLDHRSIPETAEAQWVSDGGQVVELVLWFNTLKRSAEDAGEVRRAALLLGAQGPVELTSTRDFEDDPEVAVKPDAEHIGEYLYEPDGAVIRSGLLRELMVEHFDSSADPDQSGAWLLDEHIAYFSGDALVRESVQARAATTAYRVCEVLPYHVKGLRAWIREQDVTRLDIKKRGVDVDPAELRRILMSGAAKGKTKSKSKGTSKGGSGRHVTLVLTRIGADQRVAIVVEQLATEHGV